MKYLVFDLGKQRKGNVVEVQLSAATNVRLMDALNYDLYKNNKKYTYFGGYVKVSPFRIDIPESGYWVVTLDLLPSGTLKHSVKVIPKQLPDAT